MTIRVEYLAPWRTDTFTCPKCGWEGLGRSLTLKPPTVVRLDYDRHVSYSGEDTSAYPDDELCCPVASCACVLLVYRLPTRAEAERAAARARDRAVAPVGPQTPLPPGAFSIIRRTYTLTTWKGWDHAIDGFVQDFRAHFHVAPNILLANTTTHARIDMAAAKEKLSNHLGERTEPGDFATVTGFTSEDYHLDFCLDEALPDRAVSLLYDADPRGGGEPVPEEDTEAGATAPTTGKRAVA